MVLNYIWIFFFGAAFIVALCKLIFMGSIQRYDDLYFRYVEDRFRDFPGADRSADLVDGDHENR